MNRIILVLSLILCGLTIFLILKDKKIQTPTEIPQETRLEAPITETQNND